MLAALHGIPQARAVTAKRCWHGRKVLFPGAGAASRGAHREMG